MANPTTNYGFVMPTSTDLVTDLPADFDVFGQAVDNQMLTNANAAIAKTIVDAKGDIIAATAADTVSRLAVGANNTVLTADSTTATGLKWAATSASGLTLIKTQTIGSGVSSVAVTDAFSSTYDNYLITIAGGVGSALAYLQLQLGSQTSGYYGGAVKVSDSGSVTGSGDSNAAQMSFVGWCNTNSMSAQITVNSPNLAKVTSVSAAPVIDGSNGISYSGQNNAATQFTGFTIKPSTGTITGGTIRVYGYQNS